MDIESDVIWWTEWVSAWYELSGWLGVKSRLIFSIFHRTFSTSLDSFFFLFFYPPPPPPPPLSRTIAVGRNSPLVITERSRLKVSCFALIWPLRVHLALNLKNPWIDTSSVFAFIVLRLQTIPNTTNNGATENNRMNNTLSHRKATKMPRPTSCHCSLLRCLDQTEKISLL